MLPDGIKPLPEPRLTELFTGPKKHCLLESKSVHFYLKQILYALTVLKIRTICHGRDNWLSLVTVVFTMPARPLKFTWYCLTQWILKLLGSFEIHWVRQYLGNVFNEVEGGYTCFTFSVCPSVDRIVSTLYLQQYTPDPFHIYTSFQATSEGLSHVRVFFFLN